MALSDFELPTEEIRVGKTTIIVRGLGFADVALLITRNKESLEKAVTMFGAQAAPAAVAAVVIAELPDLVAQVIACACDEPGAVKQAQRLPAPVQLEAVLAIGRLTFEETGSVKKFAEQVADIVKSATAMLPAQVS